MPLATSYRPACEKNGPRARATLLLAFAHLELKRQAQCERHSNVGGIVTLALTPPRPRLLVPVTRHSGKGDRLKKDERYEHSLCVELKC